MSLKNGVVLLLGQGVVSSMQVSNSGVGKTSPDLNLQFDTLRYRSLSCLSPYIHPSITAIHLKLGFISKYDFFQSSTVKCWYFIAHPKCLALFPLLRNGLETVTCPLRPQQTVLYSANSIYLFYLSGN